MACPIPSLPPPVCRGAAEGHGLAQGWIAPPDPPPTPQKKRRNDDDEMAMTKFGRPTLANVHHFWPLKKKVILTPNTYTVAFSTFR